jgi:hypothetical protein
VRDEIKRRSEEVICLLQDILNQPGVRLDRGGADPFFTDRGSVLSLSLSESGVRVPPVNDDRPVLRPMGTLRALRSRTYGPT